MNKNPLLVNHAYVSGIKPSMRYDGSEDFEVWQARAKEKLSELLGMKYLKRPENLNFKIEYQRVCEDYTECRFTIMSEENYGFPCVLRYPNNAVGRIPLMICLQGHSTGFHISQGIPKFPGDEDSINGGDRDFLTYPIAEGFAALAIEQRNFGECGGDAVTGEPQCIVSTMSALLYGRTTIAERIHDVDCAIDAVLENFNFIDKDSIMLMGNSGGGTATFYAACMLDKISLAMPSCSVCTYKDSIAAMYHCTCNFIPGIANYFDMGDIAGIIAPRKLIVVNGKDDPIFPDVGVKESYAIIEKLYKSAGAPDNCALVTGDGGHRFYAKPAYAKLKDMLAK